MRPLVLLEINEVPWKLIDRFKGRSDLPNLGAFFSASRNLTTRAMDEGELSPWITWPTFHRGIPNTQHGVQFLGQDPASFKGTPIWEVYRQKGHSIGIFGSLQSWPPTDPGPGGFYVPDTFAKDESCLPRWIEPFQRFNLKQTNANKRVVSDEGAFNASNLQFLLSLPKLGIQPSTCAAIARQLVEERVDRTKLARRPTFQGLLAWDVFRKLFDPKNPPAFSTFFTNHVAGVEHRYWDHIFPEDFDKSADEASRPHLKTMLFALRILDRMLGDAMEFCRTNPEILLVFAASMGQDVVHRDEHCGYELTVPRVGELMAACGLGARDFEPLMAMAPQICVQVASPEKRRQLRTTLEQATALSGQSLFAIDERGDRLSISLYTPKRPDVQAGRFKISGAERTWAQCGIDVNEVPPGTAYHIPEGALAVYGRGIEASDRRTVMPATEAKDFLLKLSGVQ